MRITIKVGLLFAALFIIIKMMFFYIKGTPENLLPMIMINILFVLLSIAIGLYLHKKQETEQSNLMNDIKNGMSAGVPYALIISIFLYLYYAKIDPGYNEHKIAEHKYGMIKNFEDPEQMKAIRQNPKFVNATDEEIQEKMNENAEAVFTAGNTATISVLAMILLSTLYSILVAIVYKRLIFRR